MYAMMTTSSGGYGQGIRVFGNGGAGHLHIIEIGPAGHEGRIALDRAALEDLHATIGRYLSPLHEARLGELKAQPLEEDEASRTEHLGWAVRVPGNNANRDSNFVPRGSVGLGSRLWTDEDEAQREAAAWREDGYEAAVVEVVVPGPVEDRDEPAPVALRVLGTVGPDGCVCLSEEEPFLEPTGADR